MRAATDFGLATRLAIGSKGLRELGLFTDSRAEPVKDIDRDGEDDGEVAEDETRPFEGESSSNVFVHFV